MPDVSVIIPVYNVERYLDRCLNSVLEQTLKDIEIICVNDGSTDKSGKILDEYATRDKRIKIQTQSNRGQSAARNQAVRCATGEYIFFLDADDFIHPQILEILYKTALNSSCSVVALDKTKVYDNRLIDITKLTYDKHKNALRYILGDTASSSVIWNKLYKTELVKKHYFIEGIYFEDWPWISCLFADLDEYATVPYALYAYNTENPSTMRSTFTIRKIHDYVKGIKAVQAFFSIGKYKTLWPMVRAKRIAASLKMMINKTYHEVKGQPELDRFLMTQLKLLHETGSFRYRELPIKVLIRIGKILWRNRRMVW